MTNNLTNNSSSSGFELSAWLLMAAFLLGVLLLHLVPALLGGLVVYELVHILVPALRLEKLAGKQAAFVSAG